MSYEKWHFLWSTFTFADKGSRIIVTTRSENVASIVKTGEVTYQLRQLPEADCWKIFSEHAFSGDLDADPRLQQVGKKIVKKCGGLPLALRSMGALLRFERDPSKWDSILRSHVWELRETQRNNILPSLWLSYHYLPSCLKHCFAYCSVFLKDFEIQKEELILLWMAEGFLQSVEEEKRMEDVGEEYIKDLISRSLVQRSRYDESTVKMHDLVHDLALFVSDIVVV
ncbi:putative disease resistance protein RGA3 [Morus notabilis]|uniref:putative disease resistance protein RGA3 n=1 Tax=Morus notabilis TaxID=981085 RepID=UPI000CED7A4F|nr:putative disease resistance protein RGA3 [Morus notabilis]